MAAKTANTSTEPKVSERTCVACRKTAPRKELLRFTLVERNDGNKVVEFDQSKRRPGRGVWTHSSIDCFEKAVDKGLLARGLRVGKSAQSDEVVNNLRSSVAQFLR